MKKGFSPGVELRPTEDTLGILTCRVRVIRYDQDGFYLVETPSKARVIIHEEDFELASKT